MSARPVRVVLRSVSASAAEALLAGATPPDVKVAPDHPTEFSTGVAQSVGGDDAAPGPFFLHRADDDVVVGEIGGAFVDAGTVEIGYAVVESCWGRGYASDAVRGYIEAARDVPAIERLVAHTPLDRPASARVVAKAGFTPTGEIDDEHEGTQVRVQRWEHAL